MSHLSKLCEAVLHSYISGDGDKILDLDREVEQAISSFQGLKSQFLVSDQYIPEQRLKVSLVLSDFTAMYGNYGVLISKEPESIHAMPSFLSGIVGTNQLPAQSRFELRRHLAFWDDPIFPMLKQLAKSGRVMIRPMTELLVHSEGNTRSIFVERDSPAELLISSNASPQAALQIKSGPRIVAHEDQLATILVPYLENVSYDDLARILDDESDILSEFRVSVRDLVINGSTNPDTTADVFNDFVRPAVDKVERTFRKIANLHRLKAAGAAVSTVSMGLLAYNEVGVASTIAKLVGPAGIGLIGKEVAEFLKAKADLREMPYYLLWRLKNEAGK